ncbi:nitroreductase family deazaflavin-dependent oxidoreductase [Mangrovimicrobium sediminis]|uniref:Nitroreductase family deazaflavin-dependent oxidoreductase n=1 Tax=Mangrovimicrobium sediminis TaxID=2562682 RepID=A0A4Z0M5M9_9GAMM|nr:nitroreductase family deazaflavin-dependent oxidoreductase [Haliea sp. SAOS-164]TGD74746.1 nitroreductase family deazaflavin-dependent oxidoreductase [Haliea sp. SAOS-164]
MSQENPDELLARTIAFVNEHLQTYLSSGGTRGHIMDMSHVGVPYPLPTLLLQTRGRHSGQARTVPLIYGCVGGEWVVIASKGGAPEHPAWYLNLAAEPQVVFQVGTQAFSGTARVAEGEERAWLWDYMQRHYPPYRDYQVSAGARSIPVVLLRAEHEAPVLGAAD